MGNFSALSGAVALGIMMMPIVARTTEEMIRLEEQADQLHDDGRKQLFLNRKDAIAFVIGTEVYDHLETVMDRFEDVANEISAIVIENV